MNKHFSLIQTTWQHHQKELSQIRRQVFIEEQKVPEDLEWDEFDKSALHILVFNEKQKAIATGRLKNDGQIGRMAVLKRYRNQGIGRCIIEKILHYTNKNAYPQCYLHAQLSALAFYKHFGFTPYGETFLDANIPHQSMKLK